MISRRQFVKAGGATVLAANLPSIAHPHSAQQSAVTRFGVNYVPRRNWMYSWQDWSDTSVAEDMHAIAGLGMDHVRVHCLWPIFQPGINYVSEVMLDRLHRLLDCADAAGLDVEVTVLNGWMSGFSFLPAWLQPLKSGQNLFTSPEAIAAEELLFSRIAATVGAHRRFLGFDLANEISVLQANSQTVTPQQADAWSEHMFALCNRLAPGKLHVNGVDHQPWFRDVGFSRVNLANTGSITTIHCYGLFTGAAERYGAFGSGSLRLAQYMAELAYAYQHDSHRNIWLEEVGTAGLSPKFASEDKLPDYMDALLRNGWETGKLWGITWWGSHDIDPQIQGFHPLEYTLGLLDLQNKPKPLGRKFAALAAELRRAPLPDPKRDCALVIPDLGLGKSGKGPDWSYGDRFFKLVDEGRNPAILLESRVADEAYLRSRGIRELIKL